MTTYSLPWLSHMAVQIADYWFQEKLFFTWILKWMAPPRAVCILAAWSAHSKPCKVIKIGMWQWQHVISFLHLLSASFPFLPVLEEDDHYLSRVFESPGRSHPFSQSAPTGLNHMGWPESTPDIAELYDFLSFHTPASWQKEQDVRACCWQLCLLVWQK